MNTLQILDRLSAIGFKYGIFQTNNKHLSLTTKREDKDIYLNISICFNTDFIGYMATLQVNGNIVIDDICCDEKDFFAVIDTINIISNDTIEGNDKNDRFKNEYTIEENVNK